MSSIVKLDMDLPGFSQKSEEIMAILLLGNGINQNEELVCSWDELLKTACKDDMKKRGEQLHQPYFLQLMGSQ